MQKRITTLHKIQKDNDGSVVMREREREREELQYLVIMLILPFRSLFKLWPNKIAPFDNIFFMDFYKMHQNILDKELIPKSVKSSLMYLYICQ